MGYGAELILDLRGADAARFTRDNVDAYFTALCDAINMERVEAHYWDDAGQTIPTAPNPKVDDAISAVCFIMTSSITVHALRLLGEIYINIFSCTTFDPDVAIAVTRVYFGNADVNHRFITRG